MSCKRTKMEPEKSSRRHLPLAQIKSLLAPYDPAVQKLALAARAFVLQVVPDSLEQMDVPAKMLAYGLQATYKDLICVIMPQIAWVNLGFPRGAELADPAKLLMGAGKRARHVKLTDVKQLDAPEVRALVQQSLVQIRHGLPYPYLIGVRV